MHRDEWNSARTAANHALSSITFQNIQQSIAQAHHRVNSAYTKLQNAETLVCDLETSLQITERWTPTSPEYQKFYQENVTTKYRATIDELERLVVMRLFELTKMSNSGTGKAVIRSA